MNETGFERWPKKKRKRWEREQAELKAKAMSNPKKYCPHGQWHQIERIVRGKVEILGSKCSWCEVFIKSGDLAKAAEYGLIRIRRVIVVRRFPRTKENVAASILRRCAKSIRQLKASDLRRSYRRWRRLSGGGSLRKFVKRIEKVRRAGNA